MREVAADADALDVAMVTTYGGPRLESMVVWADGADGTDGTDGANEVSVEEKA